MAQKLAPAEKIAQIYLQHLQLFASCMMIMIDYMSIIMTVSVMLMVKMLTRRKLSFTDSQDSHNSKSTGYHDQNMI